MTFGGIQHAVVIIVQNVGQKPDLYDAVQEFAIPLEGYGLSTRSIDLEDSRESSPAGTEQERW